MHIADTLKFKKKKKSLCLDPERMISEVTLPKGSFPLSQGLFVLRLITHLHTKGESRTLIKNQATNS